MEKLQASITTSKTVKVNLLDHINKTLPAYTKYLAIDDDGSIYAYPKEPIQELGVDNSGYWRDENCICEYVGSVEQEEILNWDDLVFEYKNENSRLPVGTYVLVSRGIFGEVPSNGYLIGRITKNDRKNAWHYLAFLVDNFANDDGNTYSVHIDHVVKAFDSYTGKEIDLSEYKE